MTLIQHHENLIKQKQTFQIPPQRETNIEWQKWKRDKKKEKIGANKQKSLNILGDSMLKHINY